MDEHELKRFWAKVDIHGPDDCWNWTAYKNSDGYGQFGVKGKLKSTHRISWELDRNAKAGNWRILHKCDNPSCVNPKHLKRGTQNQNNKDRMMKGRSRPRIGSLNGRSKLTDENVREIKIRILNGESNTSIGKIYNVSNVLISLIKRNKNWSHITILSLQ